MSSNSSNL